MSEVETKDLSKHMQGKVIQSDYDFITSLGDNACCYCLTDVQVQMILSITDYFSWSTRWYSSTGLIDQQVINELQAGLVEALMSGCCGDEPPIIYKWVGNVLYASTDGGVTFNPAPQFDYRNTSTTWPKPSEIGIGNTKCQCADGVVVTIRDKINQNMTETMTAAEILGVIAAALLIFLSAGTTAAISGQIVAVGAAIVAAGVGAYQAAFTTDVYDKLRCLVYCHMTDDESIDQAGVDAIYSEIDTKFTGIVVPALKSYIGAAGLVGINNMLRSNTGDPDANCDDCCPDCSANWIAIPDANIGILVGRGEGYVDIQAQFPGGEWYATAYTGNMDTCCKFDHYEILSGTMNDANQLWKNCGSNDAHTGPLFGDNCIWTLQFASSMPFTIRMFFVEC